MPEKNWRDWLREVDWLYGAGQARTLGNAVYNIVLVGFTVWILFKLLQPYEYPKCIVGDDGFADCIGTDDECYEAMHVDGFHLHTIDICNKIRWEWELKRQSGPFMQCRWDDDLSVEVCWVNRTCWETHSAEDCDELGRRWELRRRHDE